VSHDGSDRRRSSAAPLGEGGWLSLSDDDLLFQVESLPEDHDHDDQLVQVVRSERHFFVRQEAAKRIRDPELLKAFLQDRHIGQILVRQMNRASDVAYLEQVRNETRYLEVRKAADAQLRLIHERHGLGTRK
jgi:hypothetical protein